MQSEFIVLGGVYHVAMAVFHLAFGRLFNWENDLRSITFINRNVMLVMNLCLIAIFTAFAYLSFVHTDELQTEELGKVLLVIISLFWFARAFMQVVFFKLEAFQSKALFVIFVVGIALYAVPLIF